MSPSLSGHPLILAEICRHLEKPELHRMLRLDHEIYHIAGKALYRYLTVDHYSHLSLLHPLLPPTPPRPVKDTEMTTNTLLAYVETLDVTEASLVAISNKHDAAGVVFPILPRLKSLIVHAVESPALDLILQPKVLLGAGLNPELLVVLGDIESLHRITHYPRTTTAIKASRQAHTFWPSVKRLHHIALYKDPEPYPADFIRQTLDCDITSSLPNLLMYDFFFDFNQVDRQNSYPTSPGRHESHLARSVAWTIRNTREDLPLVLWLSEESQEAFDARTRRIKHMIRQPFTMAAASEWNKSRFVEWEDARLADRLALVEMKLCGDVRERNWCDAADGRAPYDENLLQGRRDVKPRGNIDLNEEASNDESDKTVDWTMIQAGDDGEEIDFGYSEPEDEDEESEEGSDEEYYGSHGWDGGYHDEYGDNPYDNDFGYYPAEYEKDEGW